jgi:cyclophilin family peptidyl-prolyl cis-trans isomerase
MAIMQAAMKLRPFLIQLLSLSVAVCPLLAQDAKTEEAKPAAKAASTVVKVKLETSKGDIELELDPAKAPITVANYVGYVKKGHYDGTIFHRVIPGFMIQGGGFTADMAEKEAGPMIKNEGKNGLKNDRGTIAMARRGDPDSASAQFFINVGDNAGLNFPSPDGHGYAVFGKVTKGMEIADAIVGVPTANVGGHGDVPVEPITLKKANIVE